METANPQSTETPSVERQPKPRGAMGIPFRRRFHMLRSGAAYQEMLDGNPQPNRRALRDTVRARTLKTSGRVKEIHPEFVPQATASASSVPASDTLEAGEGLSAVVGGAVDFGA